VDESGSTDGRFPIVANAKRNIQVATNPGQFYYNIIWENKTGATATVNVAFMRSGVNPKGAQAIHALAIAPPFSGINMDDFNAVNEGIPGGSDDLIEGIVVPANWFLWVSYHLEWAGLGQSVPGGCATTCPTANQLWTVKGTISGAVDRECTAGAAGYKK
jgi:hypothetical protein